MLLLKEEKKIGIEEFAKIDLRVGLVEKAERIPGTKLLKLIVDIGEEKRQVIAGIGDFYNPEDLIGRKVVVVANLKPKKIRGYISEAMILASGCDKGERPCMVYVEDCAKPGWRVC